MEDSKINITIKLVNSQKSIQMQVNGNTSIAELKKELLSKAGDSVSQYLSDDFYFNTAKKALIRPDSKETLSSLEIKNCSILFVIGGDTVKQNEKDIKKQEKEILSRQETIRNTKSIRTSIETEKDDQTEDYTIKDTLEDMAGLVSVEKIKINSHPDEYISIEDALQQEKKDKKIYALGLLAAYLKNKGVNVAIEKEDAKKDEDKNLAITFLQFLVNGLMFKKKYYLTFDFSPEKIDEYQNEKNRKNFIENVKEKLANFLSVQKEDIIVTYNKQPGTFSLIVIYKKSGIKKLEANELINEWEFFNDLNKLVNIDESILIDAVVLNKAMLDSKGDNDDRGWGHNEKRGGEDYYPPEGWVRYGLNVYHKYDNGDNEWLSFKNKPGEWCIAYHEITRKDNENVNKIYANDKDKKHPGQKVGNGTFCTPLPLFLKKYVDSVNINGKNYQMAFMLRVKPDKIRCPSSKEQYWVVNGEVDEIRPYGLLVREEN